MLRHTFDFCRYSVSSFDCSTSLFVGNTAVLRKFSTTVMGQLNVVNAFDRALYHD